MEQMIKTAKYLIENGKVKKIGENGSMGQLYEVGDQTVRIYPKPGRKMVSCSCDNFTMFCNQPRICHHIISSILFESHLKFYEKVDELIEFYKNQKELNIETEIGVMINDLQDLKRIK